MDVHHLAILNSQLESLIQQRRFELEKLEFSFMNQLFERGCGFTEFLVKVFCQVSWRDVENCRLVSKRWKEFIDRYVVEKHPAICNYYRWMDGQTDYTHLYCGGEVRHVCSDENYIFCSMRGGKIMVFFATSFLFVTSLEEKESFLWQLQVGLSMLVAVTEVSVVIWDKLSWKVVGRVNYWSEGEPYLHVEGNLIVAPGATKYTSRVLIYDREQKVVKKIKDLIHRKMWVLGAYIENDKVLTLSVPACKSVKSRELKLWSILNGSCLHTQTIQGAIGGFPALIYPYALLPTASKGLEVWNLVNSSRTRCISTNVFSYKIKNQFLFVLSKHSKLKIFKIREITSESSLDQLWCRELSWPLHGPNVGSIPKFQVETSRVLVLTTTANAEDILLIISMKRNNKKTFINKPERQYAKTEVETINFESAAENIPVTNFEEPNIEVEHLEQLINQNDVKITNQGFQICQESNDEDNFDEVECVTEVITVKLFDDNSRELRDNEDENEIDGDGGEYESDLDSEYTYTYEEVTDSEYED